MFPKLRFAPIMGLMGITFVLVFAATALYIALFQPELVSNKKTPSSIAFHRTGLIVFGLVAIPLGAASLAAQIRNSHVFYSPDESGFFHWTDFDDRKTIEIGDFIVPVGRHIVVRPGWTPDPKKLPVVKSFVVSQIPTVTATFRIQLIGCFGGKEEVVDQQECVQSVYLAMRQSGTNERSSATLTVLKEYPKYFIKVKMHTDYTSDSPIESEPIVGTPSRENLKLDVYSTLSIRDWKSLKQSHSPKHQTIRASVL